MTAGEPSTAGDVGASVPLVVAAWHLTRRVRANAEHGVLAGSGLTLPDYVVLHLIHSQPQIRVLDVGQQIAVAKATLSDILAKLTRRGFITRERPSSDRRTVVLACTPAGSGLVTEMAAAMRTADAAYVHAHHDLIALCAALGVRISELDAMA